MVGNSLSNGKVSFPNLQYKPATLNAKIYMSSEHGYNCLMTVLESPLRGDRLNQNEKHRLTMLNDLLLVDCISSFHKDSH